MRCRAIARCASPPAWTITSLNRYVSTSWSRRSIKWLPVRSDKMDQPTIDRATYDELKDTAGDEFVAHLVDTFAVEAPRLLDDLRGAYEKRDAAVFRRTAHSLKSNGNTFGARTFAAMAKDLELGGMSPVADANGAPIDALAAEFG